MSRLEFSPTTRTRLVESGLDVVVTGGGGWLGQATLEMLESSLGAQMTSRTHVFASRRRSIKLRSNIHVEVYPLTDLPRLKLGPHILVHYAFATRELVSELGMSDYIAHNEQIAELVTGYADKYRPVGMLVPSSGAVYLGDDLNTNPYGVLKARDERRFASVAQEMSDAGAPSRLVMPRLFNLGGQFLNKPDHYVLGSIIRDIGQGGPIRLRANRPVVRSYVHVEDLVDLAFAMMLSPVSDSMETFDTAGEREVEVGELAELAASVLGKTDIEIRRPRVDHAETDRYVGDPVTMRALARAHGIEMKTLPRQIEETALYMGT